MAKLCVLKELQPNTITHDNRAVNVTVKDIPIGDIRIKGNVRIDYTEIDELAESIRRYGLLQPITVYMENDYYIVKTGHRRFLAYQRLYLTEPDKFNSIRCIISDDNNTAVIQLVENVQRVDLSQIELFNALNGLKAQGMTLKQIAEVMGKTEKYVKNLFIGVNDINRNEELISIINSPASGTIQDIAETKSISDKNKRLELLEQQKEGKISRSEMREKVKALTGSKPTKKVISSSRKQEKVRISIKTFLTMNKITIYLKGKDNNQLLSIEEDVNKFFNTNKEKYILEKSTPKENEDA